MTTRPGDFDIDQYASFSQPITWYNDAGFAVDLTDYTARMDVRSTYDGDVLLTLSSEDNTLLIDPLLGQITINLTPEQTGAFEFVRAYYDLVLTDDNDVATRILEGILTLKRGVTHE